MTSRRNEPERGVRPTFDVTPATKVVIEELRDKGDIAMAIVLEKLDTISQEIPWLSNKSLDTEYYQKITNGRVSKLENDIEDIADEKKTQASFKKGALWVVGGLSAIAFLLVTLVVDKATYLIKLDDHHIKKIVEEFQKNP